MQTDVIEFLLIVKTTHTFSTTALIATTFSAILWLKHIKSTKSYHMNNKNLIQAKFPTHIILYLVVVVTVYYYVSVVL